MGFLHAPAGIARLTRSTLSIPNLSLFASTASTRARSCPGPRLAWKLSSSLANPNLIKRSMKIILRSYYVWLTWHTHVEEKLSKLKPSSEKLCTNLVENMAAVLDGCSTEKLLHYGLDLQDCDNICLALQRLSHLGKVAVSRDVHLLVDAEYSYVNSGCSIITLAMMAHFNQHSPVVANTFQCYFKDTWKNLNDEINISQQLGACFAAKIVRGAYLEKERCIAPENVCTSHACTGENYNKTIEVGLHHAVTAGSKRTLIIIATHNENSVISALQSLQDMGISRRDGHVVFAQIYGMGEQISMPLAHAGYIVYKSVPMGPLNQVLPYLARRVAENRSVLQGARKERELLQQELKHRMLEKLHVVNIK